MNNKLELLKHEYWKNNVLNEYPELNKLISLDTVKDIKSFTDFIKNTRISDQKFKNYMSEIYEKIYEDKTDKILIEIFNYKLKLEYSFIDSKLINNCLTKDELQKFILLIGKFFLKEDTKKIQSVYDNIFIVL